MKYNDWRADLQEKGYAVVKGAIPRDRALEYQKKALAWVTSVQSKINTFHTYRVAHEKFMWDARLEPGVVDAFAHLTQNTMGAY